MTLSNDSLLYRGDGRGKEEFAETVLVEEVGWEEKASSRRKKKKAKGGQGGGSRSSKHERYSGGGGGGGGGKRGRVVKNKGHEERLADLSETGFVTTGRRK